MPYTPRPHASAALQHLRQGVLLSGGALAICLLAYVFIALVAHTGDAHQTTLEPVSTNTAVVASAEPPPSLDRAGASPPEAVEQGVDPNTVGTAAGLTIRRFTDLIQTVGVIAAVVLVVVMLQGVSVAGGASVPGVERVVTAATWSLIIALLVLPLGRIMPGLSWGGVFRSFDDVLAHSEAYGAGGPTAPGPIGFYGGVFVLPTLLLAGVVAAVLRFRSGVEAGVIVTHASQLDEKIEREVRSLKLGQLSQPRAVGALHQAIGGSPEDEAGPRRSLADPDEGEPKARPI